jgi:hypothetical protein
LGDLAHGVLQERGDLLRKHLDENASEDVLHVVATMSKKSRERREYRQELVESHPAALTENAILPGFVGGAPEEFP